MKLYKYGIEFNFTEIEKRTWTAPMKKHWEIDIFGIKKTFKDKNEIKSWLKEGIVLDLIKLVKGGQNEK